MQPPSRSYLNADRICRGKLAQILADARADGMSYARIATLLESKHKVLVSAPTVGAWLRAIDADAEQVAS